MADGRRRPVRAGFAGALVATAVLGACGPSDETAGGAGGRAETPVLTIENFRYSPNPLVVPSGARVVVANNDDAAHTVTGEGNSFDTGNVAAMAKGEITVSQPGEVAYFCSIHDYMRGVIRVEG